jgi:2-polyprenyl-3-methyl-5-hydroxy-6-metoxy-1,4-benzoquinol methylase
MIFSNRERQAPTKIEHTEPSHLARYKFAEQFVKKDNVVLDVPCGSGYGTKLLSSKGAMIYGIDINKDAIEHANEFFKNDLDNFCIGDAEDLRKIFPDDKFFDVIISLEGIEHFNNPNHFLSEVERLLKTKGKFIISTPRKPHGSPFHITEYNLDEFRNVLLSKFKIEKIYGQVFDKFHNLSKDNIDPSAYEKFNFVAICSPR